MGNVWKWGSFASVILAVALCLFQFQSPSPNKAAVELYREGTLFKSVLIADLEKSFPSRAVTISEPHERGKEVQYQGFVVKELLAGMYGAQLEQFKAVAFICQDGYRSIVPIEDLVHFDGLLVFKRLDKSAFTLTNYLADPLHPPQQELGPFYLVWDNGRFPELSQKSTAQWPFQIVRIEPLVSMQVATIPHPAVSAPEEVKRGYELFRLNCLSCHHGASDEQAMQGGAPSIAQLKATVHKQGYTWFQQWLSNPRSIKQNATMPPVKLSTAQVNDIIRYLKSS
jgi:cytochrome c2